MALSTLTIPRPQPDEAASFYHGYIAKVRGEKIAHQLEAQLHEVDRLFANVTETAALARYAEGKWSSKEILGHLSDTERIFSYRLLRIARGDPTPLAGYDENAYVPAGRFDRRPLGLLLAEFRAVRISTAALIESVPQESWTLRGEANGKPFSARALAYIIVGHVTHHLGTLRDRYGL
jgi:DinB family protein